MQDYYFCEECEEYHHPNRVINGEVLAACECLVKTEDDDASSRQMRHSNGFRQPMSPRSTHIHQSINFSYLGSPRPQKTLSSEFKNMPFLTIMSEENRRQLQLLRVKNKRLQQQSIQPRLIHQVPQVRSQKVLKPFVPQQPQPRLLKIPVPSKIELVKPMKVGSMTTIHTPIQSINNLSKRPGAPLAFEAEEDEKECCYKCCYF